MRNVIVTGGSRGLGLAIGSNLARAGYQVIAIARTESDDLKNASASAAADGQGKITFRPADLTDTTRLARLVTSICKEVGPIYALVNNAGIGTSGVLAIMPDEQIIRLTQLNVTSPIMLTKYVVRSMMLRKEGRIVNISSIVSATGYSGLSAYAATKAALTGFTRSLAREVGSLGITVNAVAPGFINTEMTGELGNEERERIARRSALRRLAEPADIAAAVEFLLSPAARNVTGTTLTVDAGNTA